MIEFKENPVFVVLCHMQGWGYAHHIAEKLDTTVEAVLKLSDLLVNEGVIEKKPKGYFEISKGYRIHILHSKKEKCENGYAVC